MEDKVNLPKKMPARPTPPKPMPPKPAQAKTTLNQQSQKEEIKPVENDVLIEEQNMGETTVYEAEDSQMQNASVLENNVNKEKPNKKQRDKKSKEPKPKKVKDNKKKRLGKKAIIIIALCVFVVVAGIAGGITVMVLKNKQDNTKLATPALKVEQLYNGTVLESTNIKGAVKYEFEVEYKENNKKTTIPSTSNTVELKNFLSQVGEYSVKVRVFGKGKGSTSDYSPVISFENYLQLETPKIFLNNVERDSENNLLYKTNDNLADDNITWDAVENASKYEVRYGANVENASIKVEEIEASQGLMGFPLSKIYKYGTGSYQISIIAIPEEGSNYLQSEYEKIVTLEYYAKQDKVVEAKYDKETKDFEFKLSLNANYGNEFMLSLTYLNQTKEHKVYLDKCTKETSGDYIIVKTNLGQIDAGNLISMNIKTLGDGKYSTDSENTQVTFN